MCVLSCTFQIASANHMLISTYIANKRRCHVPFSFSKSENGEQDEELLEADSTSLLLLPLSSVAVVVVLLPPEKRDYFSTRVLPGW